MRIIHTSDLHLESAMNKLPPDRVRERKDELFGTFMRMADEAAALGARIFIIAGDLFDTEKITKRAAERVIGVIRRHPEIDFLYLPGNHERGGFLARITAMPENLRVFDRDWTYFEYGDTVIAGRSECASGMFCSLALDEKRKNIVVLHGEVKEHSVVGEGISLTAARERGIDYIALGHYHSYRVYDIGGGGVAVYSGTPEGRGFDEAGECGFVLVDTDGGVKHRFCPFAKRTVRIIEVDISGSAGRIDIEDRVDEALSGAAPGDIVRVVLTGERVAELYADIGAIYERYRERYYLFEINDMSRVKIEPELYAYDKSFKGEFIRLVYARDDLDEEMKDRVIRCGLTALMGETSEI